MRRYDTINSRAEIGTGAAEKNYYYVFETDDLTTRGGFKDGSALDGDLYVSSNRRTPTQAAALPVGSVISLYLSITNEDIEDLLEVPGEEQEELWLALDNNNNVWIGTREIGVDFQPLTVFDIIT